MTPQDFDRMQAAILPVDELTHRLEAKWGIGRLPMLQPAKLILWWRQGWAAYTTAIRDGDVETVERLAPQIAGALERMDREATDTGHQPLSPAVWEAALGDGRVLVVTRTTEEAHAVCGRSDGRQRLVYTMDEIARVVEQVEQINEIKVAFPGAEIVGNPTYSETIRSKAFARDWSSSDPLFEVLHDKEIA